MGGFFDEEEVAEVLKQGEAFDKEPITPGEQKEPELVIEVVADPDRDKKPWRKDPVEVAGEVDPSEYSRNVKKTIGKLTAATTEAARQRDVERARAEEAIKVANSYREQNAALQAAAREGAISSRSSQAESFTLAAQSADTEYQNALREGDVKKISDAQAKATEARYRALRSAEEAERIKATPVPRAQAPQVPTVDAQTESRIQARNAWVSSNPWFRMNGNVPADELSLDAVNAHHSFLMKNPSGEGTQEYFAHIDNAVREKYPEKFGITKKERAVPVVPAANREQQAPLRNTNPIQGGRLVFSEDQLEMAERLGLYKPSLGRNHPDNVKSMRAFAGELAGRS